MGRLRLTIPIFLVLLGITCAACGAGVSDMGFSDSAAVSAPSPEMADQEASAPQRTADGAEASRQVIANANISLVVADTATALTGVEQVVSDLDGYVADMDLSKGGYGESEVLRGSLTLRVPAAGLEEALDLLQALATDVNYLNVNRQDVTDQYSDLDARLRNLRATETELLALLTEVRERPNSKVEDILAVHRSLSQIREEIETRCRDAKTCWTIRSFFLRSGLS